MESRTGAGRATAAPFLEDADTVLLLHLDEGAGLTARDSSDSGVDGVLRNDGGAQGPAWTADSPF